MAESQWTRIIKWVLKNKGKQLGYDLKLSEKLIHIKTGKKALQIKPDVVWSDRENPRVIFEIDTGSRDRYQKSIYGSMISGLILAKKKRAIFVEITPRSSNGKKAKILAQIIKKEFKSLPSFCVIEVGRIKGRWSKENIQKSLTKGLKKHNIIP